MYILDCDKHSVGKKLFEWFQVPVVGAGVVHSFVWHCRFSVEFDPSIVQVIPVNVLLQVRSLVLTPSPHRTEQLDHWFHAAQLPTISTKIDILPYLAYKYTQKSNIVGFFLWKHRKNCECCHHHSFFKGHNVIVYIVVLNCQKCKKCLKCQVSGHKNCHQKSS